MTLTVSPDQLANARRVNASSVGDDHTRPDNDAAIVVIGGGPAGIRAAQELSRAGLNTVLFNAERWQPYNRVKLTPLLSGDVQIGQVQQPVQIPGPGDVALYSDNSIVDIDRAAKTVTTKHGRVWPYSKLIIATGSRAYVPPIAGVELAGVYTFRNFDDVEKLVARSFSSRRCVIVGGGLLGLEAARGMHDRGIETFVVEHEAYLMARQLDARGGELLATAVEAMGLHVLTGTRVVEFHGNTRLASVELAGRGDPIDCDTVIICTGVRANMELARDVGLAVGRGIKVGPTLQSSDPDIYAIGECAEFDGHIYGLVGPGFDQAVAAARHIAGGISNYAGSVPATKLKIIGTDVFSMGDVEQLDQRRDVSSASFESEDNTVYRRLVLKRGRLVGAVALGDWVELSRLQETIKSRGLIYPWQLRRFQSTGLVWPKSEPKSVRNWPRAATVCNCTGVTRGQIGDCIALGAQSLDDVKRDTGASTVCGSCKIHIGDLLGAPQPREPAKAAKAIGLLSALAALGALLTLLLPIVPTASNIEMRNLADLLYLDSFTKQVSGYTLLALSVLAAILSIRKRIRFLEFGDFAVWRVFHICVGVVALAALAAHTGFRLGNNLNMWLMLTFLGIGVAGAVAGLATALEHRVFDQPQAAARLRSASFWLHLVTFWPLPLLLAVHILTVYFY
ncbi:MAG: FAD-dependent oxidoreductase [Alphaproteobacteria bacterium]|nr:FAD-dependent oxidoreductase [Alphaproteobacteria bacterium]